MHLMPAFRQDNVQALLPAVQPMLQWFEKSARDLPWRREVTPYRVWVSEIMLQQTRVEAVKPYFARFMEQLPTVEALASVPEEQLFKLWEGLGYYSRARNLQKAAKEIVVQYGGQLPPSFDALLCLPGIGRYTAGAIAAQAYGIPAPAVDGNVMRVISRLLGSRCDIMAQKTRREAEEVLLQVMQGVPAGAFVQAWMELGATVCVPNGQPQCLCCPAAAWCTAFQQSLTDELPVKAPKKARRREDKTVFLLFCQGQFALRKRPDEGLLAGLWEFPWAEGHMDEQEALRQLEQWGIEAERKDLHPLPPAKHIFTHIEWHMCGYALSIPYEPEQEWLWVNAESQQEVAVPSAFAKYLKMAHKHCTGDASHMDTK